jgi:hypothetical protein
MTKQATEATNEHLNHDIVLLHEARSYDLVRTRNGANSKFSSFAVMVPTDCVALKGFLW